MCHLVRHATLLCSPFRIHLYMTTTIKFLWSKYVCGNSTSIPRNRPTCVRAVLIARHVCEAESERWQAVDDNCVTSFEYAQFPPARCANPPTVVYVCVWQYVCNFSGRPPAPKSLQVDVRSSADPPTTTHIPLCSSVLTGGDIVTSPIQSLWRSLKSFTC